MPQNSSDRSTPSAFGRWAYRPFVIALLWTLLLPVTVSAEIAITNMMEGTIPATVEGPQFFDYQGGLQQTWDSDADWNTGTFVDTTLSAAGGSVELASTGPPFEYCLNSGGPNFTGTDGTFYNADAHFTGGGTFYRVAAISNTTDDPMWHRIRYAFTAGGVPTYTYAIPVPAAGIYEVEVGIVESFNNPPYQNQTDLTIEGVLVLNDFDPYNTTGGQHNATYHTFTTTTPDATVDLLVGHAGWYGALTFVCVREVGGGALATTGTWTSPAIDTSAAGTNVFGLIGAATTTPAGTDVRFRLSFGATAAAANAGPFIGPDGTTGTWYDANTPIDYSHDFGDQFVAVQAELNSSSPGVTPSLDTAWLTYDLNEAVSISSPMSVVSNPVGQSGWLVRVRADDASLAGATGTINLLSTSGSGDLTIGTDHPSTQIDITGGFVTLTSGPPFPLGPGQAHSIQMTEAAMAGGTTVARWQAVIGGILVTHDFEVSFT